MPAFQDLNQAAGLIIPEIILIATVCIMFLAAPFLVSETGKASAGLRHRWGVLTSLSLLCALWAWLKAPLDVAAIGPFQPDEFAWYIRGMTLIAGLLLTLILWDQTEDSIAAESFACLLAILAGVNFVALSNDLVGIFLGLEMVSIPTYILLYLGRQDWMSREATIKYFLLSIFSSAFVLFGLSWVFGLTGTTNLSLLTQRAVSAQPGFEHAMLSAALIMILAGLSFRLTAVPFHYYAPDVFQGVAPSSSAMLSFLPKVVGFVALLQVFPACMGVTKLAAWSPADSTRFLVSLIAIITMTFGNVMALRQKNVLRLLAWSSISHGGYMLVGFAVASSFGATIPDAASGLAALMFYLPVYGIMSIGVFALLSAAGTRQKPIRSLEDLHGLSQTHPATALMLSVCVFGLSGLPPTGGFLAKLNLFVAAWSENTEMSRTLAMTLALNAVIAAAYYLRIIGVMYFEKSRTVVDAEPRSTSVLAGAICSIATVMVFLKPQWLWDAAAAAVGLMMS